MSRSNVFFNTSKYFQYISSRISVPNSERFSRYLMYCVHKHLFIQYKKFPFFYKRIFGAKNSVLRRTPYLALIFAFSSEEEYDDDLLTAVNRADLEEIRRLIQNGADVNHRHYLGWTILHLAAARGYNDVVEELLDLGADPDLGDNFSDMKTVGMQKNIHPLHVWRKREREFCQRLSSRVSFHDCTALHYAALCDNIAVAEVLLRKGANPLIKNSLGHIPMDYAKSGGLVEGLIINYTAEYEKELREIEAENRRKFPLEDRLKLTIVGQEEAIDSVAAGIRRKENGWFNEDHPLVFLFLGSSGIGKTELAKKVAYYLHKDNKNAFIRLDMSEYQEKHEVAKLIGSPPGYIGYDEGGQLTRQLKSFPNAVVLFDEVDKAHPDVLTALLQLFDEGRLTDGRGKTIECKDAIFIMTTNLASGEIGKHVLELRAKASENAKQYSDNADIDAVDNVTISRTFKDNVVYPILKKHFRRDEFLGRINDFVYFLPFTKYELQELVQRELQLWADRAEDRHGIVLTWDETVLDVVCQAYDVHYGARSIIHEVERLIISPLAIAHEENLFSNGYHIHVRPELVKSSSGSSNENFTGRVIIEVKTTGYHKSYVF